jgi:hypothetical protein
VFAFGAGVAAGAAIWGGIDWWRNRVDINVNRYNSFNRANIVNRNWTHNPAHRGAVPYRDRNVAQQFGRPGQAAARESFRGTAEAGRREIARRGAGKVGQNGGGAGKLGAAAAGAAAGAAAKRATGDRAGAAKQARSTPAAEHRQASSPKQTERTSQGAGNRHVAHERQQATGRQASGPRQQAARQHASAPRPAPTRHASAPSGSHISRGAGGARAMARGGGRRSDIRLKHDITLLGRLENGLGFYRFVYDGEEKAYVGVMAQEVRMVMPEAVVRGRDGYFRVFYDKLGLQFQSYEQWLASGARIPVHMTAPHQVD